MNALQKNDGAGTMFTKSVLTITLLAALSATVQAGQTISDKGYWPSEASRETLTGTVMPQRDLNSAFAYDRAPSRYSAGTPAIAARPASRYQGGPKSR
jgi:hypothetical protein